MSECLSAFTANDPVYPPYINISTEDENVVITVRHPPRVHPLDENTTLATVCGDTASITLDKETAIKILSKALNKLQESTEDGE